MYQITRCSTKPQALVHGILVYYQYMVLGRRRAGSHCISNFKSAITELSVSTTAVCVEGADTQEVDYYRRIFQFAVL